MFNTKYSVLSFTIQFQDNCKLNKIKTSSLRGILGQSLAMTNCINNIHNRDCDKCFFNEKCLGNNILKAKLKYKPYFSSEDTIAPFIIECEDYREEILVGETLNFTLIILGDTSIYIPYIIKAYEIAGIFLGLQENLFNIVNVRNEFGQIIYNGEILDKERIIISTIEDYIQVRKRMLRNIHGIELITPLRFKQNGKFSKTIDEKSLMDLIIRRIIMVNALENNEVKIENLESNYRILNKHLHWEENERYSNRQNSKMSMGGIKGDISIKMLKDSILDFLIAGELLHLGKSTVFGLGKYLIY